jgi:hypothetical protein
MLFAYFKELITKTLLDDIDGAYELMKDQESSGAQYSLLKAITCSIKGKSQFLNRTLFFLGFNKKE